MLDKIAKVLKASPDAIKSFAEENIVFHIQNMNDNSQAIYHYNFNPLDKYLEAIEENKKIYERLLQTEREKAGLLEKMLEKK